MLRPLSKASQTWAQLSAFMLGKQWSFTVRYLLIFFSHLLFHLFNDFRVGQQKKGIINNLQRIKDKDTYFR